MCVLMMNCQDGLLTKHLPEHVLQRFNLVVSKRSDAVLHHFQFSPKSAEVFLMRNIGT